MIIVRITVYAKHFETLHLYIMGSKSNEIA